MTRTHTLCIKKYLTVNKILLDPPSTCKSAFFYAIYNFFVQLILLVEISIVLVRHLIFHHGQLSYELRDYCFVIVFCLTNATQSMPEIYCNSSHLVAKCGA